MAVRRTSDAYYQLLNLTNLVTHHRAHCDEECAVSLLSLRPVAVELANRCIGDEQAEAYKLINKTEWM